MIKILKKNGEEQTFNGEKIKRAIRKSANRVCVTLTDKEEEGRKRGIHIVWVYHALMNPTKASRKDMRNDVNRYMQTVLREEPLDPTIVDFDDTNRW